MQIIANRLRAEMTRLRKMAGSCDNDVEKQLQGVITEMQSIAKGLETVDQKVKGPQDGGTNGSSA